MVSQFATGVGYGGGLFGTVMVSEMCTPSHTGRVWLLVSRAVPIAHLDGYFRGLDEG